MSQSLVTKKEVNFEVLNCIHTVTVDKEFEFLNYQSEYLLKKVADKSEKDVWSLNSQDQELNPEEFTFSPVSDNLMGRPDKRELNRGRIENFVELYLQNGESNNRLPIGSEPKFQLNYKIPLKEQINYGMIDFLPFLPVHVIHLYTGRLFNPCNNLKYNISSENGFKIVGSLPPKYTSKKGKTVFSKTNLKPDESYSLFMILSHDVTTNRFFLWSMKAINWMFFKSVKQITN